MCTYEVEDKSTNGVQSVLKLLQHFFPYAQKQLGFHKPVMISFESDEENSNKLLGRTGHYNPDDFSIGIYVDGRHPKDVLRSLSHELIHHTQNCNGEFDAMENLGPGYAQDNPAMRDAELDAYKRGNIIFRDFEDLIKKGEIVCDIDFEELGEPRMSLKEWKNNELNMLLLKKWGLLKEQQRTPVDIIRDVVSGKESETEEPKSKPTEAEILAAADERRDYRTDLTQDAESYGRGEGRVAGQRRVRQGASRVEDLYEGEEELNEEGGWFDQMLGGWKPGQTTEGGSTKVPETATGPEEIGKQAAATGTRRQQQYADTADDVGGRVEDDKEHADEEGNRPSMAKDMDLDEGDEIDEGIGDWLQQKLGGWKPGKQTGTMPKNPAGPEHPHEKDPTTGTGSRRESGARKVFDHDSVTEDLEELTRWNELAGLDELATPPPPELPPPPPSTAGRGRGSGGGDPAPPFTARRDDGKRATRESITIDEARDVARRIFEKLSERHDPETGRGLDEGGLAALKRAMRLHYTGTGGRVTPGGSQAPRTKEIEAAGEDPSLHPWAAEHGSSLDRLSRFLGGHTGGRVTRGGKYGRRAQEFEASGDDPSQSAREAEADIEGGSLPASRRFTERPRGDVLPGSTPVYSGVHGGTTRERPQLPPRSESTRSNMDDLVNRILEKLTKETK